MTHCNLTREIYMATCNEHVHKLCMKDLCLDLPNYENFKIIKLCKVCEGSSSDVSSHIFIF
jgi:hypothetical protein